MASSKKYSTYIIGFPEAVNNCPRILVCNSVEFVEELGDISLFTASEIASKILSNDEKNKGFNGLVISKSKKGPYYEYRKDNLTWLDIEGDPEASYNRKKAWGFDIMIYLTSRDDVLGYTKFSDICGGDTINLNIYLNFRTELDEIDQDIVLDISLSNVSSSLEEETIQGYLKVGDLTSGLDKTTTRYSPHLGANDIAFLGDRSVISGQPVSIGLMHGEIVNPYINWSKFESHQIGYYGGDDIVLESWTPTHYNIVSLIKRDHWGHPLVYTISKEGRRPIGKYHSVDTEILYLSGRYVVCNCSGVKKIYDTLDSRWLETLGSPISDPLDIQNKITDLRASVSGFSQIAEYVPEINETFLDLTKGVINLYRKIGPWFIIENESKSSIRNYKICGPTMTLYILKSELPYISFLNDSSILYYNPDSRDCCVYCGFGKTFISKRYDLNFDKIKDSDSQEKPGERATLVNPDNILGSSLDSYRRREPVRELPRIITGFGGLVFYTDDKNRLYYL